MEKTIRILSLSFQPTKGSQDKPSKDKWVVETASGNFSIWEEDLAVKLKKQINQLVSVEVREAQEGTNYLPTITAMNDASDGTVADDPIPAIAKAAGEAKQYAKGYTIDQRIAAAVNIKCASDMLTAVIAGGKHDINSETAGKFLCMAVTEIHGAHKLALSMQDE